MHFLSPSIRFPTSRLARGWRYMALSWFTLMLRQLIIGVLPNPMMPRPWWAEVFLLVIYGPGIALVVTQFSNLPFQRRSKLSLILDCLAVGIALTITISQVFSIPMQDIIFISGNTVVLFACYMIYQQAKNDYSEQFRAISFGVVSLIMSDSVWLFFRLNHLPLIYSGPFYTYAWLNFSRTALVAQRPIHYNEDRLISISPLQDGLGVITLVICSIALIATNNHRYAIILLLGLLPLFYIETTERQQLYLRLDTAKDEEAALRLLIRSMAHDLKSPINVLGAIIRRLKRTHPSLVSDDMVEAHADIHRRTLSMLDVARTMNSSLILQSITITSLHSMINTVWRKITTTYPASIQFTVHMVESDARINVDPEGLSRAIENILINAVKSLMRDNTDTAHIECSLTCSDTHLAITCSDTGQGFSTEFLQQQQHSPVLGTDGTGLGLKGVLTTIHAMHGSVHFHNQEQTHGAVVTLLLPLAHTVDAR